MHLKTKTKALKYFKISQCKFLSQAWYYTCAIDSNSAAGVVVSCKIPILATRVRFPGGAHVFVWEFKDFSAILHFLAVLNTANTVHKLLFNVPYSTQARFQSLFSLRFVFRARMRACISGPVPPPSYVAFPLFVTVVSPGGISHLLSLYQVWLRTERVTTLERARHRRNSRSSQHLHEDFLSGFGVLIRSGKYDGRRAAQDPVRYVYWRCMQTLQTSNFITYKVIPVVSRLKKSFRLFVVAYSLECDAKGTNVQPQSRRVHCVP